MTDCLINSAALYFRSDAPERVPTFWLTRAVDFFSSQGVTLDYFYISAMETFSSEGTYDFAKHKEGLFKAVNDVQVESLALYSNPDCDAPKTVWQAMVSIRMHYGEMFVGIDAERFPQRELLLRSAYFLGGELLGVKYGISYARLLSEGPDSYASGTLYGSLSDVKRWLSPLNAYSRRMGAWQSERYETRRYLTGMFRGAYPASIITSEHLSAIRGCTPFGHVPGKITSLVENKLWLWELADSEINAVEELLQSNLLLIE